MPQRVVRDFGQRARQFHAGGATAHNRKREPLALLLRIRLAFGSLEGEEDLMPDFGGLLDGLQAGCVAPPFVVAEIRIG